ncbi:MAG: M48 family metallopeptidase [Bacteroidia bacterium]
MKKNTFLLLLILVSVRMFAQQPDFNNYQPLKCSGAIPDDFLRLSQDKYKSDVKAEAQNSKNHNVSSDKEDFLLATNYIIDQLLLSGKVLFGDTVTNYVNLVADRVLVEQPELRSKLRFYCLKSSEANAFSTNQGIIFITLGLIAQLENEAQLAFVISHEVAHYERRHTMEGYLKQQEIFADKNSYKYNTYDDQIRTASTYSKEMELEADSLGLLRLSKTGYACDESVASLFVLQFSELPFNEIVYHPYSLQNPVMQLPKDLFLDTVKQINFENDNDDDSYATHPNIAKRRKRLEAILGGLAECGTEKFVLNEPAFYMIRKISRFETVRIMLNARNYCAAYYNSYVLLDEDSTSDYLKICTAKALYGMAKYKNHYSFGDVSEYYNKKEGQQQQVYFLFSKLTAPQLNMIALRYLYNLSLVNASPVIAAMRDDLAEEAVRLNEITFPDMQKTYALYLEAKNTPDTAAPELVKAEPKVADPNENGKAFVSKYDKLRQEKKKLEQQQVIETKKSDGSKFYLLAFGDVMDKADVKELFAKAESKSATRLAQEKTEKESEDSDKAIRREEKEMRKHGKSLGIDTVIYVDPFYYLADDRKGLKLVKSETEQLEFSAQINENAYYANLSIKVLNPKTFTASDVEQYNDLAVVNDWMGERLDHDDELEMLPIETDRMQPLTEKYNTNYFCYTGIYSYKEKRSNRGGIIFFSVFVYPLLPVALVYAFTPEHHTYFYTLMYNVQTGKPELIQTVYLKSKAKKGFINSIMYDTMLQIKREKKDKKSAK